MNVDIVAWIKCEALGVDYPVVQGKDNVYYLNHTFSKVSKPPLTKPDRHGTICGIT